MIYDSLDFFLLKSFLVLKKDQITTTWTIAENFNWDDKPQRFENNLVRDDYFTGKNSLVTLRINKMVKEGIFIKKRNGDNKNIYVLLPKKVVLSKKKMPDGKLYNCILIKEEKRWCCFQI